MKRRNLRKKATDTKLSTPIETVFSDKHLDPILSNLIKTNPDILLIESFLKDLLTKITFEQLIAQIYFYPDVYDSLMKRQDFWIRYYSEHYSTDIIQNKDNVVWFYEIFKHHFSHYNQKNYLSTNFNSNLSKRIVNFIPSSFDDRFIIKKNNILPYKNVKKYLSFSHSIARPVYNRESYSFDNVYDEYRGTFILFEDRKLFLLTNDHEYSPKEDNLFLNNVQDIINVENTIVILTMKGSLKFKKYSQLINPDKYQNVSTVKKGSGLLFEKGVKINVAMTSVKRNNIPINNELFLITSDSDYNIYFFRIYSRPIGQYKHGAPKIQKPVMITLEPFKDYFVFNDYMILYITVDNKLKYDIAGYRGEIKLNVQIRNIEFFKVTNKKTINGTMIEEQIIIQLEDTNNNFYWLKYSDLLILIREIKPDAQFPQRYNLDFSYETIKPVDDIIIDPNDIIIRSNIKIQKIIFNKYNDKMNINGQIVNNDNTFRFYVIGTDGNIYLKLPETEVIFRNLHGDEINNIENILRIEFSLEPNFTNMKLVSESDISDIILLDKFTSQNTDNFEYILRSKGRSYVLMPYSLYLYYLAKGEVDDDIVLNNTILFQVKGLNYIFRTEIN